MRSRGGGTGNGPGAAADERFGNFSILFQLRALRNCSSSGLRFTNPGSRGELTERFADNYCSFAYSALACFTMGGRAGETECSHGLPTTNYLRPLRTRLPLAILTGKTLAAAEVGCQSIRRNRPHGDQWAPDFGPP